MQEAVTFNTIAILPVKVKSKKVKLNKNLSKMSLLSRWNDRFGIFDKMRKKNFFDFIYVSYA